MNLPNKLTVLRMCMIPVFVALFFAAAVPHHYLWALAVFAIASLTDLADGKIARSRGLITDFGKLMDPLADKLLVMSAMVCLVGNGLSIVLTIAVVLILAREFLVSAIRQLAAANGTVLAADNWGKAKTVFQMVWICVMLLYRAYSEWFVSEWFVPEAFGLEDYDSYYSIMQAAGIVANVLLYVVTALTVISGARYLWQNRKLFADA